MENEFWMRNWWVLTADRKQRTSEVAWLQCSMKSWGGLGSKQSEVIYSCIFASRTQNTSFIPKRMFSDSRAAYVTQMSESLPKRCQDIIMFWFIFKSIRFSPYCLYTTQPNNRRQCQSWDQKNARKLKISFDSPQHITIFYMWLNHYLCGLFKIFYEDWN